jgi:hypothetical protein
MSDFAQVLAGHRRITMLRLMSDSGGSANESTLQDGLEMVGLEAGLTREALRDDLKFLEERGAIQLKWYGDKLVVAHITTRGVDIAKGRVFVDGIKRPSIGV